MSFFACIDTNANTSPRKRRASSAEERLAALVSRTGKSITNTKQDSNIYSENSLPPKVVLNASSKQKFTDDMGRVYWKTSDVKFEWPKAETIKKDGTLFNKETDEIYFVRNGKGKPASMLINPPPEENLREPVLFYQQGKVYKGVVVSNGFDEIFRTLKSAQSATNGTPRTRATSYVVIRWQDGKKPPQAF